jgi:hypothetical protein
VYCTQNGVPGVTPERWPTLTLQGGEKWRRLPNKSGNDRAE